MLDEYWNKAFAEAQHLGHYPPALARAIEPHIRAGDMERIQRPTDWFGLNHYSPVFARAAPAAPLGFAWADAPDHVPKTQVGWQVDPAAFRDTLVELDQRYRLPIYILENGAGGHETLDATGHLIDLERIGFLAVYAGAMHDAMAAGADVRGYFVWSLLISNGARATIPASAWSMSIRSRRNERPRPRRIGTPISSAAWWVGRCPEHASLTEA